LEIDARNEGARRTTVGLKEKDKLTERTAGSERNGAMKEEETKEERGRRLRYLRSAEVAE
jgi:hypothetical protein